MAVHALVTASLPKRCMPFAHMLERDDRGVQVSYMGSLPPSSALSLHVHALLLEHTTLSLYIFVLRWL
jgi:hypothetical protein